MLWTIAVVLIILWLLGLVSSYTMGGFHSLTHFKQLCSIDCCRVLAALGYHQYMVAKTLALNARLGPSERGGCSTAHDRCDQQDMNEPTHRVAAHQSQQPQDD